VCRRLSWPGPSGHRVSLRRLKISWFHIGEFGSFQRFLTGRFGPRRFRLGFLVQIGLLSCRCIRFAGGSRFGPGLFCFLVPLPCCCSGGLRFHFLAGLADLREAVLPPLQFIGQLTAAVSFAVATILLGNRFAEALRL
jgi:hypothetical protein